MKIRCSNIATLVLCLGMANAAVAQSSVMVPANAQEMAPEALLGVWKADIDRSHYVNTPPRNNIRSFSYTRNGKVLVTSTTLNTAGGVSMLHWAVQLDGTPAPEYTQVSRSTPASLVGLKMEDARTFVMTVTEHGEVTLVGEMKLSDNGEILTYSYGAPDEEQNNIVYHRWDMND